MSLSSQWKLTPEIHKVIAKLYQSGEYKTETLAKEYGVTDKTIQRIARKHGVIRTQAEANKVAAPLKHYHTVPIELRAKRKWLTNKRRFELISSHPYCNNCGMRPDSGVRLEVDHIDEDATNNDPGNLQVLCGLCNTGKSHLARFGN